MEVGIVEAIIEEYFGPDNKYKGAIYLDRLWIFEKVPVSYNFPDGYDHRWIIVPDFHGWNHGRGWAWNGTGNNQGEYGQEWSVTAAALMISFNIGCQIPQTLLDALEAVVLSMRMQRGMIV